MLALFVFLGAVAAVVPAGAMADVSFCEQGSGAGQCSEPEGVAVDAETNRLYVADAGNNRIDVFTSSGTFLLAFGWGVADGNSPELQSCGPGATPPTTECFPGIAGSGAGQLSSPRWVAVDNAAASGAHHDVYVGTNEHRIQKFEPDGNFLLSFGSQGTGACQFNYPFESVNAPIAVGSDGTIYAADSRKIGESGGVATYETSIQKFNPAGGCLGSVAIPETGFVKALAVDGGGDFYLTFEPARGIAKYSPTGTLLFTASSGTETSAISVDSAGTVFAAQSEGGYLTITAYDESGAVLKRFGYRRRSQAGRLEGLAALHTGLGDLFGSESERGSRIRYFSLPPAGPVTAAGSLEATAVRSAQATLAAAVNPEGKETSYHFEYLPQAQWETEGGFSSPNTKSTPVKTLPADYSLHGVSAVIGCANPVTEPTECLAPETIYRFRIVATNADGAGEGTREGQPFTTKEPFEILATWAQAVGTDSATLRAEVNPLGVPATGFFEYVSDAQFQESGFAQATKVPAGEPLQFGSGEEPVSEAPLIRGVPLTGLALDTTYHYRFTADDELSGVTPRVTAPHTFTTFALPAAQSCPQNEAFRTGPSVGLPDCRAYEMVSPLEKENGDVIPLGEGTTALPATLNESAISGEKLVYGSYRSFDGAESAPFTTEYLAQRQAGVGWATHPIVSPRGRINPNPLSTLDTELKALSPDLCNSWFRSVTEPPLAPGAVEGFNNIYRRQDQSCGEKSYEAVTVLAPPHRTAEEYNPLELQGLSGDGSAALYVAPDNLPGTGAPELSEPAATEKRRQLYLHTPGKTTFVCVLPNGVAASTPCQAGGPGDGLSRTATENNSISTDGSRVFWTSYKGFGGPGRIYLRRNPSQPQSTFNGSGQCKEAAKACTAAISEKAEELSGGKESQFWAAAEDGSWVLFTTINTASSVSDLYEARIEVDAQGHISVQSNLIAHKSSGVLGAAQKARRFYFASEEALAGSGTNSFGEEARPGQQNLYYEDEGTPRFVMTLAEADVNSAFAAINRQPVYRATRVTPDGQFAAFMSQASVGGYDNHDAASGKADAEVYLYEATAGGGQGKLICASCNPTNSRPAGIDLEKGAGEHWAAAQIPGWQNTLYASRALSENGSRLFFESSDALVPADTNGVGDVYEWEAGGTGGCVASLASYVPATGGCLDLISTGKNARSSSFTDASPTGADAFFVTLQSLVPADYGLVDVYDARINGGLPSPAPREPECEGEACQHPSPAPELPSVSSEGFQGAGNVAGEGPRSCPKGKVRRHGRCVKKKHSEAKHHKKKHGTKPRSVGA